MRKLLQFLRHFDRPPQQLFLDFTFVEVNEDDVAQFRYKLDHPILRSIYDDFTGSDSGGDDDAVYRSLQRGRHLGATMGMSGLDEEGHYYHPMAGGGSRSGRRGRRLRNLPTELSPRL